MTLVLLRDAGSGTAKRLYLYMIVNHSRTPPSSDSGRLKDSRKCAWKSQASLASGTNGEEVAVFKKRGKATGDPQTLTLLSMRTTLPKDF